MTIPPLVAPVTGPSRTQEAILVMSSRLESLVISDQENPKHLSVVYQSIVSMPNAEL